MIYIINGSVFEKQYNDRRLLQYDDKKLLILDNFHIHIEAAKYFSLPVLLFRIYLRQIKVSVTYFMTYYLPTDSKEEGNFNE